MRIALVCPYAWDSAGGVQTHVRALAAELRGRGHQVLVLTPSRGAIDDAGVVRVGSAVGVPFNGSVAPISPNPWSRRRIARELAAFQADVVHVHEPLAPSTSMFAALGAPSPVVATFHAYVERSLALAVFAPALRSVWKRIAVRVAVSPAAASLVSRWFPGEIRIVPNGVDVERFATASPAELPVGRRILFVGRLDEPRKGLPVLVQAFGRLATEVPGSLLVAVGAGRGRALEALPPELRTRVVSPGFVSDAELPGYFAAADVFVAPATHGESFGVVVPVIASDIPGYRSVVAPGASAVVVEPADAPALAAAIRRVLEDRGLADRLGAAARTNARRYAWAVVADELELAYGDAVAAGRPGRARFR